MGPGGDGQEAIVSGNSPYPQALIITLNSGAAHGKVRPFLNQQKINKHPEYIHAYTPELTVYHNF
jgi:hypothetical protein